MESSTLKKKTKDAFDKTTDYLSDAKDSVTENVGDFVDDAKDNLWFCRMHPWFSS